MSFTTKSPAETYKDLTYLDNNNGGVTTSLKTMKTGTGASSSLSVSDRSLLVKSNTNNTVALDIQNASSASKLVVDTSNNTVKALGHHINNQYAYFGIGAGTAGSFSAGTHIGLPFMGYPNTSSVADNFELGTGTDPNTTFTTADGGSTDASVMVTGLWYVPDSIKIDSVTGIEGGDNATGDTTRMHLMSYTFTSGSTSALTSGTLLAHNDDVTNAGSEQAYLSTFTVDSASVVSGKVIVATFRADTVNSDYSLNIIVKYHLT